MKKTIFSIAIGLLAFTYMASAQLAIKPTFGINFANIKNSSNEYALDGKTGFQIGGSVAIGSKLIFEPGIFWQKDNYEVTGTVEDAKQVIKGNYNSFKIPVHLGYYIIGDSKSTLGIRVFGGPSAKFTLGAGSDEVEGIKEISKDDINNAIWGVKAGAGVEVLSFFAELGYNWGLNEVFKEVENSQTNHFELTFGLKF